MAARWLVLFCLALLTLGCKKEPTSTTVQRRDVEGFLVLKGDLVTPPTEYADVLPPFHAPVEKVMVTEGKWVREGDVLMQLSFPSAQAGLEQARASLTAAKASHAAARAQLDDDVKRIDAELKALRSLQAQGEDVAAQIAIQEQQLSDARRMLEANMAPYRADVRAAQLNLEQAQSGAKLASVRAPISGTVLRVYASAGQVVGEDRTKPVATICDLAALVVHTPLKNDEMGSFSRGAAVKLTIAGIPDDFDGRVARIITRAAEDEVRYIAVVEFDNKQGLVKPGAQVKGVAVKIGEANDVLAVPNDALDKDPSGKPVVKVLKNGEWTVVIVEVGLRGAEFTEIKSGLKEGATVQVTP